MASGSPTLAGWDGRNVAGTGRVDLDPARSRRPWLRLQLGTCENRRHPGAVSLNRCEDAFLHYLRAHPDEHRFWHARVLAAAREPVAADARTAELERALRAYAAERARSDPTHADALGAGQISLRNLAEYLLRTWPPPRPPVRPATR